MLISGIQGNSSLLSELSTSSLSSSTSLSSSKNAFNSALSDLFSAIQAGDTANAQKYLAEVQKLAPSNTDSNSPLGKFLSNVSSALQSNDMASAQSALTTFENQMAPPSTAGSAASSSTSNSTSGTLSAFTQDIVSLFSSIGSGDLAGAQAAYDNLTSLLAGSSSGTSASSSTDTTSTDDSTASSSTLFSNLLKQLGSALSTGDISSAQSALDSFLQSLSSGSLVSTSA